MTSCLRVVVQYTLTRRLYFMTYESSVHKKQKKFCMCVQTVTNIDGLLILNLVFSYTVRFFAMTSGLSTFIFLICKKVFKGSLKLKV